jgi:hypothetical protein
MYQRSRQSAIAALWIVASTCVMTPPVQGGPFLDWLFGRSPSASPAGVAYYPPTTTNYAPGVAYYAPTTARYTPTTAYYAGTQAATGAMTTYRVATPTTAYSVPASSSCCGTSMVSAAGSTTCCSPTVVYQSPQTLYRPANRGCFGQNGVATTVARPTRYRTTWKRIPVTSYRPTTTSDPMTGCPVTVMRPCTTYTWQAERRRCGFFGRLFGRCDPEPAQVVCCPDPCLTQCVPSCGPSAPVMAPAGPAPTPAAPYYSPSPSPLPGSNVMPPGGSPQPSLDPQDNQPNAPANVQPRLQPGEASGIGVPPATTSNQWGSELQGAESTNASLGGPDMAGPQQSQPPTATMRRMIPLPPRSSSAPEASNVRPVPGPDAKPAPSNERRDPPPLLDPRDRVASTRDGRPWAVTPISWPSQTATAGGGREAPQPQRKPLDDGGWYSVAQ